VLREGFFSTTNLPTYVRVAGEWRLPRGPRMDSAIVLDPDGVPRVLEGRYVRAGQPVALGLAEDGSEGIYVHAGGFLGRYEGAPEEEQGLVTRGIMYSLVRSRVPFVLAGSIRDDGPLPDTITDAVRAQEIMRDHAKRATAVIMIATALYAIAIGNMLPSCVYDERTGAIRPLTTICVDSSELVVSKLKDRGTHQAFGVITNAQDFLHVLRHFVEEEAATLAARAG
jgi:hypothetical protein